MMIENVDKTGTSDLHMASLHGDTEKVRELIAKGADVNRSNRDGCTPLHFAAQSGHVEIARMLVDAGADLEAKTRRSETPLALAVTSFLKVPDHQIVGVLLELGADPDSEMLNGFTPRRWAVGDPESLIRGYFDE